MDDPDSAEGIVCTECGRIVEDVESAKAEGWRFFPAEVDDPHPFCPECAEREFGPAPPDSA